MLLFEVPAFHWNGLSYRRNLAFQPHRSTRSVPHWNGHQITRQSFQGVERFFHGMKFGYWPLPTGLVPFEFSAGPLKQSL
jgi:hypothetical protein